MILASTLILLLMWELGLLMRSVIGLGHRTRVVLPVVKLSIGRCLVGSRHLHDREHLILGVNAPHVRVVEVDHVVLDVLGFVYNRHVLELSKEPMSFTVSIIKQLIVDSEVCESGLIREVKVDGSLSFDKLSHTRQFGLHVVEVLLDGFRDKPDFAS